MSLIGKTPVNSICRGSGGLPNAAAVPLHRALPTVVNSLRRAAVRGTIGFAGVLPIDDGELMAQDCWAGNPLGDGVRQFAQLGGGRGPHPAEPLEPSIGPDDIDPIQERM
jgi:hypothetical protein